MKEVTFISTKETLRDILLNVTPTYSTLLNHVQHIQDRLSVADKAFCNDSFIFPNDLTFNLQLQQPPRSIEQLLEEVVRELLGRVRKPYVQCLGQQYSNFKLKMKSLNFARTILETTPTFRSLFAAMHHKDFYRLLLNYIIIVPYKGEYVQVAGRMLNEKYNMKAVGGKRGATDTQAYINNDKVPIEGVQPVISKESKESPLPKSNKQQMFAKSYTYSNEPINRFQIFYCSTMNRSPGIFAKNIFFDKGVKKSMYINECDRLIRKCLEDHFRTRANLNTNHIDSLYPIMTDLFESMRDLMNVTNFGGRKTSCFNLLLSRYCRLTPNYHKLKEQVRKYSVGEIADGSAIFDGLYGEHSPYDQVQRLISQVLRMVIPAKLLGPKNKTILIEMMGDFISMKRFQNYKIEDFLYKMNAFELIWANCGYNKKYHHKIVTRRRKLLALTVGWIVNQIVVPILKFNFYVTEKHKEANKIFYYRKPVWTLISKTALKKFSEENLQSVDQQQVLKMKKNLLTMYPEGKLRILPKKGTFRPIITFNRKVQFSSDFANSKPLKATLNQILGDTQLVLRNLKNILGDKFGFCIFDNRQIMRKYDAFVEKWRKDGCPQLKYFTLDIHKCYDSIDTSKLLRFIEESPHIDDQYLIIKYNRLYRNKKPLYGSNPFTGYFNYKERVTAVPMKDDLMQIREQHKVPSINIFPAKQKLITKETIIQKLRRICQGSIVSYKKNYWLQKLGIPQGLNVSGVLCSLYFACLEDQYVKVKQGLLMRLTDDYFYIGPEREAVKVLDNLLLCAQKNGFRFSEDKISKNFEHPVLRKINNEKQIIWIGKKINVQTLQMCPNFEMSDRVGYAMNVNLNKNKLKSFLKNKLKSLLTNHFASYFKPKLFPFSHLSANVRLYTRISLEKFYPFLQQLVKQKVENIQELVLKIFKSCVHEFLLFACMLAEHLKDHTLYNRLYVEVSEEITAFLDRRASLSHLCSIRRIFAAEAKRLRSQLAL